MTTRLIQAVEKAPNGSTIVWDEGTDTVEIIKPAGDTTMTETDSDADTTEKVETTETGYRLTIESTRGTGTRDQDKVKVEGKAETWEKLNEQRTAMRTAVENEMNQRRMHHPDTEEQ